MTTSRIFRPLLMLVATIAACTDDAAVPASCSAAGNNSATTFQLADRLCTEQKAHFTA